MLILIPLFKAKVPENANMLFGIMMEVATFDFVETGDTVIELFDLPDVENPTNGFDDLGMD